MPFDIFSTPLGIMMKEDVSECSFLLTPSAKGSTKRLADLASVVAESLERDQESIATYCGPVFKLQLLKNISVINQKIDQHNQRNETRLCNALYRMTAERSVFKRASKYFKAHGAIPRIDCSINHLVMSNALFREIKVTTAPEPSPLPRVICLPESHEDPLIQRINAYVVQELCEDGDWVLCEGTSHKQILTAKTQSSLLKHSLPGFSGEQQLEVGGWDDLEGSGDQKRMQASNRGKRQLQAKTAKLESLLSGTELKPDPELLSAVKGVCKRVIAGSKAAYNDLATFATDDGLEFRNRAMYSKIKEILTQPNAPTHIFVVGGNAHFLTANKARPSLEEAMKEQGHSCSIFKPLATDSSNCFLNDSTPASSEKRGIQRLSVTGDALESARVAAQLENFQDPTLALLDQITKSLALVAKVSEDLPPGKEQEEVRLLSDQTKANYEAIIRSIPSGAS